MKIFKFLAVFLVVIGLVYIIVIGSNWNVFRTVFSNQEALAEGSEWIEKTYSLSGLTEFIRANPELVSVVMQDTDERSDADSILYQPDVPRAMGSTGHIFLLLNYAEQVNEGKLSPDSLFHLDDIERFNVPGYEPNRHKESLRHLKNNGKINDDYIRLDDIVAIMILRNHQPSADLLYTVLGRGQVEDTVERTTDNLVEVPKLWSAFHIAATMTDIDQNVSLGSRDFETLYNTIYDQLISPGTTAASVLRFYDIDEINYSFFEEKAAYTKLPKATPLAIAQLLATINNSKLINDEVRSIILKHLSWPMHDDKVKRDFESFYAIYDNRIAISNGISIGTSVYTKRTHVSVVYFDQLPIGFWMHMSSNLMNQDFQMRLNYDPALFERTYSTLMQSNQ